MFCQRLQQFGIRGWIRVPHVVFRINQTATKEMLPITVDECASEETVLFAGHPIGKRLSRVIVGRQTRRRRAQPGRLYGELGFLVRRRGDSALVIDNLFARSEAWLLCHGRKEGAEAVIV